MAIPYWQIHILKDSTIGRTNHDIYDNQCLKFRKLVTLLPAHTLIPSGEEIMRFITRIALWPDDYAAEAPAHMFRPLLDSDQEILYHHLRVLIVDHGLDPNIGFTSTANISIVQWAAVLPSVRGPRQMVATGNGPREAFLSQGRRRRRCLKMCQFLLAHGADPRLIVAGAGLPVRLAHFLDHMIQLGDEAVPVLRTVLEKWPVSENPDFYTQHYNSRGDNPLHAACRLSDSPLSIVRVLLEHGFKSTQENQRGKTALQIARSTPKMSEEHRVVLGLALHGIAPSDATI